MAGDALTERVEARVTATERRKLQAQAKARRPRVKVSQILREAITEKLDREHAREREEVAA